MGKPKKKGSAAAEPVEEVEVDVSFLLGGDSDEETAEGAASSSNGAEEAAPSEKKESKSNMSIRHNREIKELKARTDLMFAGTGKDKAKKKVIETQIKKLQADLEAKQAAEVAALEQELTEQLNKIALDALKKKSENQKVFAEVARVRLEKALNRERRRLALIKREDGVSARVKEFKQLMRSLKPLGLAIREVVSDGHCMFRAVADQFAVQGDASHTVESLRKRIVGYMRNHADDFMGFLETPNGDPATPAFFRDYCRKMENTAAWGGHLELEAMAHCLGRTIIVHQASGEPLEFMVEGASESKAPLRLAYHEHQYAFGAHYNSVVPEGSDGLLVLDGKKEQAFEDDSGFATVGQEKSISGDGDPENFDGPEGDEKVEAAAPQ